MALQYIYKNISKMAKRHIYTKIYKVACTNKDFKFYISKYNDNSFHGEIWMGFANRLKYPRYGVGKTFINTIKFDGNSEKLMYNTVKDWIEKNISKTYKITLTDTKN